MFSKEKIIKILRWSEKYTKTDMVYFTKGSFWLLLDNVLSSLFSLASMIAFSYWLPKEAFGTFQYITSTIGIVAIFSLPAMEGTLTRAIAKGKEGMVVLCAKVKLKWSMIGSLISLGISSWYFIHQNHLLAFGFLLGALFMPLTRVFNLGLSFWQGKKKFDIFSKYKIFINLSETVFIIVPILLTKNLVIVLTSYFVSRSLFRGIVYFKTLRKTENSKQDKETIPFGKHITLMSSLNKFADGIDNIIIWQFLGPIAVAIYNFAKLPINKATSLIPLDTLALPKLSQRHIPSIKQQLIKKLSLFFLMTIPLAIIVAAVMPLAFKIVFPAYLNSIPYAQILCISFIFLPFVVIQTALVADLKTKELYIIKILPPIIKIGLLFFLIPIYQLWGVIAAILISQAISAITGLYFFSRI